MNLCPLTMLVVSCLLRAIYAAQVFLDETPVYDPVPTRTIIDILSDNMEFSTILTLIQSHGLVNTINTAVNATLLAPINSAFIETSLQKVTRDQLLYMLVNQTVILSGEKSDLIAPTFYVNDGIASPVQISDGKINHEESQVVVPNLLGSPGRGVVQGISSILNVPQDLCEETFYRDDISIFTQFAGLGNACSALGNNITVFIPNNHAMSTVFSKIELMYLFSGAASDDRRNLLYRHTMDGELNPADLPSTIRMKDGSLWQVDSSLVLNKTHTPTDTFLCASNGIFNVYQSLLGSVVDFTPEKYILALRGYSFVRALSIYGYEYLIDGSNDSKQTILVPVISPQLTSVDEHDLQGRDVQSSLRTDEFDDMHLDVLENTNDILYQFFDEIPLNGSVRLVNTKMSLKSGKYNQRAALFRSDSGKNYVNWQQITSQEYRVGNTTLMTVDGKLSPPARLQLAVGPLLTSSYSLGYLEQLDLLQLPADRSWTLLLPTREAWDRSIILKYYFDAHHDALQILFNSLIFSKPLYSDSGTAHVETLDNREVEVKFVHERENAEHVALEVNGLHFDTDVSDVLFDNGVVHCITNLNLPKSLVIDTSDLIESGQRSIFLDLLSKASLEFVLEPSSGNFTIIVPSPEALAKGNYTLGTPEKELEAMLLLHIIEGNPVEGIKRGETLDAMSGEALQFEKVSSDIYSISPISGGGQRVFVTGWGDTNGQVAGGNTVLFIDSLISPKWLQPPFIRPPFRFKSHTLLLIGAVLGLMLTGLIAVAAVYIFIDDKVFESQQLIRPESPASITIDEYQEPEEQRTQPIAATHVAQGREYGQHLGLP